MTTDDTGRYRLFGLHAGDYVVSATVGGVGSSELPGYARAYFPGTTNPGEARFVSIGTGREAFGIDLAMSRVPTVRVAGRVLDAAGRPSTGGSLMLLPSQQSAASVASVGVGARVLPDGAFEFPNVTPGQYVIRADRNRLNSWTEGEFGALPVTVTGRDVGNLTVQMASGSSITGRLTFDALDQTKLPAMSAIEITPVPVDFDLATANTATANVHPDGTFELIGINGRRRLQVTRMPPRWMVKEIRVRGIDVTDQPMPFGGREQSLENVEIVFTDRINELSGTVVDTRSRPVADAAVIAFTTDRARWFPQSRLLGRGITSSSGMFSIPGLPFGSYYVAVLTSRLGADAEGWQDPTLLESLVSRASSTTLGEGDRRVINLRLR